MRNVHDALRAAGIWLIDDARWPGLGVASAGMARRVRERGARTVGLVPADDDVAVPAAAICLGRALAGLTIRPVAVVDTIGSWLGNARSPGADPDSSREQGSTRWVADHLWLLVAPNDLPGLPYLRGTLAEGTKRFDHLVFDLTGMARYGEQAPACELLEAVILVARSGRATGRGVRRRLEDLPADRCLGVLLTGA